jgi:hypothetical protein
VYLWPPLVILIIGVFTVILLLENANARERPGFIFLIGVSIFSMAGILVAFA